MKTVRFVIEMELDIPSMDSKSFGWIVESIENQLNANEEILGWHTEEIESV